MDYKKNIIMISKITTKIVKNFIKSKGGSIAKQFHYIGCCNKFIILDCGNGHSFKTNWDIMSHNHWCPKCHNLMTGNLTRKNINEIKKYVKQKGGSLDNNFIYKNAHIKFYITCSNGHRWKTTWNVLQRGSWCDKCYREQITTTSVKRHIKKLGGVLRKNFCYINNSTKFTLTCPNQHKWKTDYSHIKRGQWCPYCHKWTAEQEFRKSIEKYFNISFLKLRYKWLIYKNSRSLELDGYNEDSRIAFEYQGFQHYQLCYLNNYQSYQLQKIKDRDNFKIQKCHDLGICLIVMPCWVPKEQWCNEINRQYQDYLLFINK